MVDAVIQAIPWLRMLVGESMSSKHACVESPCWLSSRDGAGSGLQRVDKRWSRTCGAEAHFVMKMIQNMALFQRHAPHFEALCHA